MEQEPLRILHLVNNFGVGGLESVIRQLVLSPADNLRPHVGVLNMAGVSAQAVAEAGIPLHQLRRADLGKGTWATLREMGELLARWDIQVLHCHDLSSWFFGALAGRRTGRRVVVTRHGHLEGGHWKTSALTKALSLLTHRIVAVSPEVKAELVNRQCVSGRKVEVIFNGIDLRRFQMPLSRAAARARLGLAIENFVTGTVTRFYPVKNLELQVDAVARLREIIPELRHLVVAPIATDYGRVIKRDIEQRGLAGHIHLLDYREDIPQVLQAMDVFVLTSRSEGTSMALIEAMAAGLPVVASNVGGNPHLVRDGVNGFLFELGKEGAFEEKILALYRDRAMADCFSARQMAAVEEFSVKRMQNNYHALYGSSTNR